MAAITRNPPTQFTEMDVYKVAMNALKMELDATNLRLSEVTNELGNERANWCFLDKQNNDLVATLSDQLNKVSNNLTGKEDILERYRKENKFLKQKYLDMKKETSILRKEVVEFSMANKVLKKKLKHLKTYIANCNNTLDDVICDGDYLLSGDDK
uniref:ORF45 n=1 Tax=Cydia pomonella granulosis virus TaxID=28289 RepID=A0A097P280_GVCP|nr:ORF45 [Cydia pomonella granulovirus]